jgi:hypothetical protein
MDITLIALPLAATGGSTIFLIFIVLMVLVLGYGMYSRKGSGIEQRPQGNNMGGAPGAEGRSRMANSEDETEGDINAHGTK